MTTPAKGAADYLALGDWNALCYMCGRKFKASQLKKYWQGFWVCQTCWEPRQPQDFVRPIVENPTPPWIQPPSTDTFSEFCTPNGLSAVPGSLEPGCATPGYLSPSYNPDSDI